MPLAEFAAKGPDVSEQSGLKKKLMPSFPLDAVECAAVVDLLGSLSSGKETQDKTCTLTMAETAESLITPTQSLVDGEWGCPPFSIRR